MRYAKERRFLHFLPECYLEDLLELSFWTDTQKQLVRLLRLEKKSIDEIVMDQDMHYSRAWLFKMYEDILRRLKLYLKTTEKPYYKRLYRLI